MLRQTSNEEQVLDRTAEVAATIAEEGLRYVSDSTPGYTRKRTGTTFSYYDKDGKRITDAALLRRIKSIGIPPAYESVWICPSANGHIQATGLDARGRKQYRYHPNGASCATKTSTNTSSSSRLRCPRCGSESPPT
jgi:DNA topoisomerase-1